MAMAQDAEFHRHTQMSLIAMNDKLDKVLSALGSMEVNVHRLEQKVNDQQESQIPNKPSLPPKPSKHPAQVRGVNNYVQAKESPTYEEVELAPAVPYRKRGKSFSTNQLDYMRTELGHVREYVQNVKTKDENERMKIIGSLNCLMSSLQPATFMSL